MNLSKTLALLAAAVLAIGCMATKPPYRQAGADHSLKEAYSDKFFIGTALNLTQIKGRNPKALEVLERHFNSIVAENCMKSMYLQPKEGEFFFDDADAFVALGEKNNMHIVGHTLIWHSQTPSWFFVDKDGQQVSREVLIDRMKQHITTVVSRYKGRIHGWDVVNEAVLDNGEWRKSKFYEIIGEDFVRLAFEFAHAADPNAELYYNDYSTANPTKRNGIARMVKQVLDQGGRVHAIGMQEHHGLDNPPLEEVEQTILTFAGLGTKVMVTEMDISVLPHARPNMGAEISETYAYREALNPYTKGLPDSAMQALGDRYTEFFKLYLKHQDKITRVTMWGISDADSWKNGFPIRGRTDYPLLFDRAYEPKPFVSELVTLAKNK
ncbi:endo-1,4-beta-xylanase [Sphingobacterium griseoflavum]|uniref:Beta-xylanase n=1 Tax=Sphingobacterium griseoflavum TaxID=1474952 RepID=A0ABQ3HZM9_9SPHI|nr:endo-1,4-beta-xylanase [Sphingobacterium griseoflavum]GHE35198.1 beta-xylanase [Sphingobacterium griseoflavum]